MPDASFLLQSLSTVWQDGGPLMWPITFMALLIYTESIRVLFKVSAHPMATVKTDPVHFSLRQKAWLAQASESEHHRNFNDKLLSQTRKSLKEYYQRRIIWLGRFIKCCPLLGLLGTVTGMGYTFESLLETGLSQAEGMATGISEALITTQYGLMVAIPGLFIVGFIKAQVAKIDRNLLRLHLTSFHHVIPRSRSSSPMSEHAGPLGQHALSSTFLPQES